MVNIAAKMHSIWNPLVTPSTRNISEKPVPRGALITYQPQSNRMAMETNAQRSLGIRLRSHEPSGHSMTVADTQRRITGSISRLSLSRDSQRA
jgi:hypothetical protein